MQRPGWHRAGSIDPPMTPDISERAFEAAIECALLRGGPDACPGDVAAVRESPPTFGDEPAPGGYHRRRPEALPDDRKDSYRGPWDRLRRLAVRILCVSSGWTAHKSARAAAA